MGCSRSEWTGLHTNVLHRLKCMEEKLCRLDAIVKDQVQEKFALKKLWLNWQSKHPNKKPQKKKHGYKGAISKVAVMYLTA